MTDGGWRWHAPFGQQTLSLFNYSGLLCGGFYFLLGNRGKSNQSSKSRDSIVVGLKKLGPPKAWGE